MRSHKITVTSRLPAIGRLLDISLIRRCVRFSLDTEGVDKPCRVSVLITGDGEIRDLNRIYRNVDKATDVLSFPMLSLTPGRFIASQSDIDRETGRVLLGDIVLSYDRIRAQAREYGQTVDREAAYLVVHSVLHLLGYAHVDEGTAKRRMRAREKAILDEMGLIG